MSSDNKDLSVGAGVVYGVDLAEGVDTSVTCNAVVTRDGVMSPVMVAPYGTDVLCSGEQALSTFQDVKSFNERWGKTPPTICTPAYYEALENQIKRVEEELNETKRALYIVKALRKMNANPDDEKELWYQGICIAVTEENIRKWEQEILDGGCDMDVVVSGFNILAGHDYAGAIKAVCNENHTKYTEDYEFAHKSMIALEHTTQGEEFHIVSVVEGSKTYYSVHRVKDDKVCKLLNHPKVDLAPFMKS